jgi:hypothetical protein
MSDPYLIPGTDVLRNKFNILDSGEPDRRINDVAIAEAAVLFYAGPPVKHSMAGWQTVHKAMFGAVFDWAGEFRTLHIRKVDEAGRQDGLFAVEDPVSPAQHRCPPSQARRSLADEGSFPNDLVQVRGSANEFAASRRLSRIAVVRRADHDPPL